MEPRITDEQESEIVRLRKGGATYKEISKTLKVSLGTVIKYSKKAGLQPKKPPVADGSIVNEFAKRARSILWRQDPGAEKKTYDTWNARVEDLATNSGMTRSQAVVRASKEYPCLRRLFREYDLREFDPNPDSHPDIKHYGTPAVDVKVSTEGTEQSYRDSLRWAIEAAGRKLRTGEDPESCPCDAAFYLYRQAVEEPKDFLAKVGQIESKVDAESIALRNARKLGNHSIQEIDMMLAELDPKEEGIINEVL